MQAIFTRAEYDFWCNYLKNDLDEMLSKIARFRFSGEPVTINEVRRSFQIYGQPFPDHPDPAIGGLLLDGTMPEDPNGTEYKALLKARAEFAYNLLSANSAASLGDAKYAELAQLLAQP
ncbi:MAG: hypothetical protein K2X27_13685 [Candidatus Obscuribacterales bacterium]|nr:hypothetical protein [Candidatus Obscuribacterales bacterium]